MSISGKIFGSFLPMQKKRNVADKFFSLWFGTFELERMYN